MITAALVTGLVLFQFQYGAIKGRGMGFLPDQVPIFQFQYGAIKGLSGAIRASRMRYFNSNMVRLRALGEYILGYEQAEFQFQYGAIKGRNSSIRGTIERLFQFQYGAIKGFVKDAFGKKIYQFQFQYGAIKGNWIALSRPAIHISIPIWCD